ncbi:hypothetical protein [Shimazuella alba]|uniref:Uncharacterized protein n=1 Tax=Shimazuella alba TaxID=2690964 RepID=A0A6I4VVM2_9BACL|nr:hypothetical protein [Shimazuella alba]MXQ54165.1 hypothetical protein [Shimazuella alba]
MSESKKDKLLRKAMKAEANGQELAGDGTKLLLLAVFPPFALIAFLGFLLYLWLAQMEEKEARRLRKKAAKL